MKELIGLFVAICILLLLVIGGWVGKSYFEATAFNNATGKQMTTWDAMFLDLRIQEQAINKTTKED